MESVILVGCFVESTVVKGFASISSGDCVGGGFKPGWACRKEVGWMGGSSRGCERTMGWLWSVGGVGLSRAIFSASINSLHEPTLTNSKTLWGVYFTQMGKLFSNRHFQPNCDTPREAHMIAPVIRYSGSVSKEFRTRLHRVSPLHSPEYIIISILFKVA
jgi:hypothetical protein